MPNTTSYEFGDIPLVPFPFTDQTTSKKRPAVIITSKAYHHERPDVILMAETSHVRSPAFGEVVVTEWRKAGLLKLGVIKPVIATIEKGLVLKRLGRLKQVDLERLRDVESESRDRGVNTLRFSDVLDARCVAARE